MYVCVQLDYTLLANLILVCSLPLRLSVCLCLSLSLSLSLCVCNPPSDLANMADTSLAVNAINPSKCKGNYSATSE